MISLALFRLWSKAGGRDATILENNIVQTAGSAGAASAADTGLLGSVTKALSEFVAALVKADGGELYLVSATPDDVHLHLAGTCAGCPGATMTLTMPNPSRPSRQP